MAADPGSAGSLAASVPDASGALNFAEFITKPDDLRNLFNAWVRELWFAPDDLLAKAIFGPISQAYCPFYLFEAKTVSQYTGQVCKTMEQTVGVEKKLVDTWSPVAGIYKGTYSGECWLGGSVEKLLTHFFNHRKASSCALRWARTPSTSAPSRPGTSTRFTTRAKGLPGKPTARYVGVGAADPGCACLIARLRQGDSFASKFFKAVVDAIPKVRPTREQLLPAEAWQIVWHEYEEHSVRPVEERQCAAKILAEERGKGVSSVKVATTYDVTRKLLYFPVYICKYVFTQRDFSSLGSR